MNIQLNGGIVIIGSLFWDKSEIRTKWRTTNLNSMENAIDVEVPIRYGRVSSTRSCTYSMVFSNECQENGNLGSGKFLEFKSNPIDLEQLWKQCTELIKAECNKKELSFSVFNWKWGALGLCVNPNSIKKKPEELKELVNNWEGKYGEKKPLEPAQFEVNNEGLIFDNSGLFKFNWPKELDDFDFFISTASKPELKEYPNPIKIAERMIVNEDESYFQNNIDVGITTFNDPIIKESMNELKARR